jgi:serine/threonine-protein kinase
MSTSEAIDHGRFAPGDVILDRYRIIGRLGKGGMGEVFRADDLRLGQPVALKFLPAALERDSMKLAQFHAEVRFARQVSHPNVCRVYDIGEAGGMPFLSMEYVDGEDLSSLIRRIGRLPIDKGLDVARQLCAGLAAAHDRGVLHRDLKPANVMLDSEGKVRLTDFGLAAVVGTVDATRAGTPAFMSPEQLAGREVDARSDIFALGVVLYEIFTGRRAFEVTSIGELMRRHEASLVTKPTQIVPDLDPLIERTILRCLEYDPARRPASALAVAAALPGGDPLAAALAAGETPSPAMVAAAGETAAMPRSKAVGATAAMLALVAATALASARAGVLTYVPDPKPRAVLVDRAQTVVAATGWADMVMSTASGFDANGDYLQYLRKEEMGPARKTAHALRPGGYRFFYRTSPRPLLPFDMSGKVTALDPPADKAGSTVVWLDPQGRLLSFAATPPQRESTTPVAQVSWTELFRAADLDPARLTGAAPTWNPAVYADSRTAWTGEWPDRPGTPLRVEAASYRGRPVYFDVLGPWSSPHRDAEVASREERRAVGLLIAAATIGVLLAAILVARMNLRAGRGDFAAALRIAWVIGCADLLGWLLTSTHASIPMPELRRLFTALGQALLTAGIMWLLYIAVEPWVRRFWPDTLKGWSRLLSGRVSDPRVGRDVMIGLAFGLGLQLLIRLSIPLHDLLGVPGPPQLLGRVELLAGPIYAFGGLASVVSEATFNAFVIVFLIVGLKVGLKRMPLVVVGAVLFYIALTVPATMSEGGSPWIGAGLGVLSMIALVTVPVRFGLLATTAAFLASFITSGVPWSLSFGSWQAQPTELSLALLVFLVLWAGWTASGGRSQATAR